MTPSSEYDQVSPRRRSAWWLALGAIVALSLIAALAVGAFLSLDLLRGPGFEAGAGAQNPAVVAPEPTTIHPELHTLPSEWDDNWG